MDIQKTTQCAPHASRPSTSRTSSKSRPSALQSHLNSYIRTCADHAPRSPPLAISTIWYSSMTTQVTPPFGSFQIRSQRHAPQPTNHFRPKLTPWDMKWKDFGVTMAAENMTIRPCNRCLLLLAQHMEHVLPTLTIRMTWPNAWSRPSPRKHDPWWLTPRCHLSFGVKQSMQESTSTSEPQMKA